jgi:endonuclease/exonuclease/phosphatase family metal-dependent hydrolase
MTTLVSWNIQNGLGIDGTISLKRIADTLFEMADADIICFQEVSINCEQIDGSRPNQVEELSALFAGYELIFSPAYDVLRDPKIGREQYGNLILSKYPILSIYHHPLPQLSSSAIRQMPRQMLEVTVQPPSAQPLCVMTTHLEFHSLEQRQLQAQYILQINAQICQLNDFLPLFDGKGAYSEILRSNRRILCGDFNFLANTDAYNILTRGLSDSDVYQDSILRDAWRVRNVNQEHSPTCGVFDHKQWPEGPHCRDFIFVSNNLSDQVDTFFTNLETQASDHQPIVLTLL